jgi:hypothetical protein
MGHILELLTVNIAVRDTGGIAAKLAAFGLPSLPPSVMRDPPAEIVDVSVPVGASGAISLIEPTSSGSPVSRFLEKRGEGLYSITVRVDSLEEVMREWSMHGVAWVLAVPYEFPSGTPAARYMPEKLRANWIKPASLNGVMLEVFEFVGEVNPHEAH